jgi:hypothetical protein
MLLYGYDFGAPSVTGSSIQALYNLMPFDVIQPFSISTLTRFDILTVKGSDQLLFRKSSLHIHNVYNILHPVHLAPLRATVNMNNPLKCISFLLIIIQLERFCRNSLPGLWQAVAGAFSLIMLERSASAFRASSFNY